MRSKTNIYLLTISALFVFASASARAQSTDPASPTPIISGELTIAGPKKNNQQFYYSFSAGPGDVTMTFNVKAKSSSTFVGVKVFDSDMNTLTYHNMSADTSSPGIAKKTFEVGEKQTLVMSFTSDSSLGTCKITFGGAVEFSGGMTPNSGSSGSSVSEMPPQVATDTSTASVLTPATSTQTESVAETTSAGNNKTFAMSILDAVGQRFNIPANGKLRIEMKDGTVQEIDLTQVKKILVKK